MSGEAEYGVEKECINNGMKNGDDSIGNMELSRAIDKLKRNKAIDDSGMIAEYLKALKSGSVECLRGMLNDILNGGEILVEWRKR